MALGATLILFEKPIKKLLDTVLINPLLVFCPQNYLVDTIFLFVSMLSAAFFIRQIQKHAVPTANSLLFGTTTALAYFLIFKSDGHYDFYHYQNIICNKATYSTTFFLSTLLLLFSYKTYLKPLQRQQSRYSLVDDSPSIDKYNDLYSRTAYAGSIAKHVAATTSDVSFAIGIIGDWGSGKSDFMQRVRRVLKDDDQENIICEFNPWRANKPDTIVEEFFKTLSKSLAPYNQSVSSTINDYSGRILKTADETHFKFIDTIINSWFQEEDLQTKYESINESIKATGKRIVVFVDDVDRLTGKEAIEVLRIIRNTANFANTFFIVGIDHGYLVSVLKNTKDFANEEEYLKKVFQLTITLPAFKKDGFAREIKKQLFTRDFDDSDRRKVQSSFAQIAGDVDEEVFFNTFPTFGFESLLEKMIESVRDLKRFCNSFKIAFNLLKEETEVSDLMVLELIRNKNITVYNSIRNKKLLTLSSTNSSLLSINEDNWKILSRQIPDSDRPALRHALEFLFTDSEHKNQRKIILPHNFYIYFSYQLFNQISFKDFNETLEKEFEEIVLTFEEWIKERKSEELSIILTYVDDFSSFEQLRNLVIALLRISQPDTPWFEHAKNLVFINWMYNQKRYFDGDSSKHRDFLISVLEEKSISRFTRGRLAYLFLKPIIDGAINEKDLFIKRKELRRIIYHLFREYLETNPDNQALTDEFYHLNDHTVKGGTVEMFKPVNRLYQRYLLSNKDGFELYVKWLFRPSQSPYNGRLVLEPYIKTIFPDLNTFKGELIAMRFDDPKMEKLKTFILDNFDNYFKNGRAPIKIETNEDKLFLEGFLPTIQNRSSSLAEKFS